MRMRGGKESNQSKSARQRTVKLSYGVFVCVVREIQSVCVCVCVCVCVFRMKNKVTEAVSHQSIPSVYDAKPLATRPSTKMAKI